jgi:hypothetical protein
MTPVDPILAKKFYTNIKIEKRMGNFFPIFNIWDKPKSLKWNEHYIDSPKTTKQKSANPQAIKDTKAKDIVAKPELQTNS